MLPDQVITLILQTFAGLGGVTLVLFLIWIFLPEKIEKWAVLLHKLLAFASERHERKYISKHIESKIVTWKERICEECEGALPYDVKIKWIGTEDIESELEKETLIVKMKNHRNQSRNFAYVVREYVPNTLIPKARRYVEQNLMEGLDYVVSKSILSGDTRALAYFIDVKEEEFATKPDLKPIVGELDIICDHGSLTRILLSEFSALAELHPSDPDEEIHQETTEFEKIVFGFATKKPQEDVTTKINRKHLQVAIVPVARSLTLLKHGIEPHINFIKKEIGMGTRKFYITAAGGMIPYARELSEKAMKECRVDKISEDEYKGIYREKRDKLYCACLKVAEPK